MIVAITGANGFIGRRLCETAAADGHAVRRVARPDYEANTLADHFTGAEVVVHAAAVTRAPTHAGLWRSNVDLTRRTLDAARAAGVKRFVFISSQAAAGPAPSLDKPVAEDDPPAPIEEYGRTKVAAEALVRAAADLETVIVRPCSVYGRGDRDFRVLFALAARGVAIHPGNRDQWVSIIHVDDCVRGILAAATSPAAAGRTYFLANDEPAQWGEVFRLAASASARRHRLWLDLELPRSIVALGAHVGDIIARASNRAGLLTTEKIALSRPAFWVCSNARARRELEFVPAIPLADGIRAVASGGFE
jgi:nucleoside-diphosphate-sugar epimerase